jgi:hypothetical protein
MGPAHSAALDARLTRVKGLLERLTTFHGLTTPEPPAAPSLPAEPPGRRAS